MNDWFTLTKVAEHGGYSYPSLMRLMRTDPIPSTRVGCNKLVSPADAEVWLARHRRSA